MQGTACAARSFPKFHDGAETLATLPSIRNDSVRASSGRRSNRSIRAGRERRRRYPGRAARRPKREARFATHARAADDRLVCVHTVPGPRYVCARDVEVCFAAAFAFGNRDPTRRDIARSGARWARGAARLCSRGRRARGALVARDRQSERCGRPRRALRHRLRPHAFGRDPHTELVAIVASDGTLLDRVDGVRWRATDVAAQARADAGLASNPLQRMALRLFASASASAACGGRGAGLSVLAAIALFVALTIAIAIAAVRLSTPARLKRSRP